jgi:hypothetical protein
MVFQIQLYSLGIFVKGSSVTIRAAFRFLTSASPDEVAKSPEIAMHFGERSCEHQDDKLQNTMYLRI